MIDGEREAAVIQALAELARGLEIADLELKQGSFVASRQTIKHCRELVALADVALARRGPPR